MAADRKKPPKRVASSWAARLIKLLDQFGTQAALAKRLRLSQSQVSAFINGERVPTRPIAYLIELLESGKLPAE